MVVGLLKFWSDLAFTGLFSGCKPQDRKRKIASRVEFEH
jgi:hypothetical protein